MEPSVIVIGVSILLGAAWCFGSGYLVGLAPFNYKDRMVSDEDETIASQVPQSESEPRQVPQIVPVQVRKHVPDSVSIDTLLQELSSVYQAQEILIFDSEGLVISGSSVDPELGLRVAGLTQGRRLRAKKSASNDAVYYREGDIGIHGVACETQPLWLVTRGSNAAVCERDLRRVGLACERQWGFAV